MAPASPAYLLDMEIRLQPLGLDPVTQEVCYRLPLRWERAAPIPPGMEAGNVTRLGVLSLLKQDLP